MAPLPNGPGLERVPSGYWKVIATSDGRMSAFVFDQQTPRDADYCAMRVSLTMVTLRSRLILFPGPGTPAWAPLDRAIGCEAPMPAEPAGELIGPERPR